LHELVGGDREGPKGEDVLQDGERTQLAHIAWVVDLDEDDEERREEGEEAHVW
jgi:hypothetical protein